jgi:hypothetical protein
MEKEFLTVHINSRKSIHFGGVIESHHESDKSEARRDQNYLVNGKLASCL